MREQTLTHDPFALPPPGDGLDSFPLEPSIRVESDEEPVQEDWLAAFADEVPAESVGSSSARVEPYKEFVLVEHATLSALRPPDPPAPLRIAQTQKLVHTLTSLPRRKAAIIIILMAATVSAAPLILAGRTVDRPTAVTAESAPPVTVPGSSPVSPSAAVTKAEKAIALPVQNPAAIPPVKKPASVIETGAISSSEVIATPMPLATVPVTAALPDASAALAFAPPPGPSPTPTPTSTPIAAPVTTPVRSPVATPAPVATPTRREVETTAIQTLLGRYRQAFGALDVSEIAAFWPTVKGKALSKAFDQLQAQTFVFDSCSIDITGEQATASCAGRANFTTKVGSRTPHVESRRWLFRLARMSSGWVILSVESR